MPSHHLTAAHPSSRELEAFARGRLDSEGHGKVVQHLLGGCARCGEATAALVEELRGARLAATASRAPSPLEWALACARLALRRARKQHERLAPVQPPSAAALLAQIDARRVFKGETAYVRCAALLDLSWDFRHDDPEAMTCLAEAAVDLAHSIDAVACPGGGAGLADLQARALGALANARRVANDPLRAESDLHRALARFDEGTGDQLLLARLMSFAGSLFMDQRRFAEADEVLGLAFGVYAKAGERHLAGKTRLKQGLAVGYGGDSARAVNLVLHSLTLIEPAREPETALDGLHNLVLLFVDSGRFEEASDIAWAARSLYASHGGEHLHIKLGWLDGRIAAGLGHPGRAERAFREARDAFLRLEMPYTAAIVALDLGVLFLEEGRTAEARALIRETLATFTALRIPREASAALLLLRRAARLDRLTVTVLRSAAADMQKLRAY